VNRTLLRFAGLGGSAGRRKVEKKPIAQPFLGSPENWTRSKKTAKEVLVAVNFRVPFEFRQRMKLSATIRGITMTELMTAAFEYYLGNVPETEASIGTGPATHRTNSFATSLGPQR
jgi:hypothetical protein